MFEMEIELQTKVLVFEPYMTADKICKIFLKRYSAGFVIIHDLTMKFVAI